MKSFQEPSMKECNYIGKIHSLESFGTVDGPGVRFVVFFQGCPMRCQYCHNPDTWTMDGGMEMTVEELLTAYDRNRTFYKSGGMTATGGEPLMQLPFLTELFRRAKARGIHTCLDTSGIVYSKERQAAFDALFEYTDLVLLDIKHSNPAGHKELTGQNQSPVIAFGHALEHARVPMIVRHVIVPGITDTEEELRDLGHLLGTFGNLKGLEVLPYHTMGTSKYEALGMEYPLKGIPDVDKSKAKHAREVILKALLET